MLRIESLQGHFRGTECQFRGVPPREIVGRKVDEPTDTDNWEQANGVSRKHTTLGYLQVS